MTPRRREDLPPVVNTNPAPRREPPQESVPSTAVAHPQGQELAGPLASLLADDDGTPHAGEEEVQSMLAGIIGLRSAPVDPMKDYGGANGTRLLRWVASAIATQSALTKVSQQQILNEALLGIQPISSRLLDAEFRALYGRSRRG